MYQQELMPDAPSGFLLGLLETLLFLAFLWFFFVTYPVGRS